MQALFLTISDITRHESSATVTGSPICVLPEYAVPPAWLRGAQLTIERQVADVREIGEIGDGLVLTPEESARWLYPLRVIPEVSYGRIPDTLRVILTWWQTVDPPPVHVQVGGQRLHARLVPEHDTFAAEIPIPQCSMGTQKLPMPITITCGPLSASCQVLPSMTPFVAKLPQPQGNLFRLENRWYRIDVAANTAGGAIASWVERGRDVEHFRRPANRIGDPWDFAGHCDAYRLEGAHAESLRHTALRCSGMRRDDNASHVILEGPVQDEPALRAQLECSLFDTLPLLRWQRVFCFDYGKQTDDKQGASKPSLLTDKMYPFGCRFHASWAVDRSTAPRSRILTVSDHQLMIFREVLPQHRYHGAGWRMQGGWVLVEHPLRREYMLYLFDRHNPPQLNTMLSPDALTLESSWPMRSMLPGDMISMTLAMSVGECCGVDQHGAWIGCRTNRQAGGIRCAVIARLRDDWAGGQVCFQLGDERQFAELIRLSLLGIGDIAYATADFPHGTMHEHLRILVENIPQREAI